MVVLGLGLVLAGMGMGYALRDLHAAGSKHGAGKREPAAAGDGPADTGSPPVSIRTRAAAGGALRLEDVERLVDAMNPEQREHVLGDAATFGKLVRGEEVRDDALAEAHAEGLDKKAEVAYLMQRAAAEVLFDRFMGRAVTARLPEDFPTHAQMLDFYKKNQDDFEISTRVPLWEILLRFPSAATPGQMDAGVRTARSIVRQIQAGKLSFAAAALKFSAQDASRASGGYMGLVELKSLRPTLREAVLKLAPGAVSDPLRSRDGIRILKRGDIVPAQTLSFAQVRVQLRERLRAAAARKLREQILDHLAQSHPSSINGKTLEEWRAHLRATALDKPGR